MEAVIKIGGSLAEQPDALRTLCNNLNEITKQHRVLIVPGGGEFADVVRKADERFHLSAYASHRMAILAMDQFGLMLAEMIPDSAAVSSVEEAKELSKTSKMPVFLPSKMMFRDDPLTASWEVTSDSIAAYVAMKVKAKKTILIKDIDGVYTDDPKKRSDAKLFERISASALSKLTSSTCVDRYLSKLLQDANLDCYVVNGNYPDRIEKILEDKPTICTLIFGS